MRARAGDRCLGQLIADMEFGAPQAVLLKGRREVQVGRVSDEKGGWVGGP